MRILKSFGLSFIILLIAGGWLATGTFVMGGQGPGNGETPIIGLIEGEEHGPIATALGDAGVLVEHSPETVEQARLTVAERIAQAAPSATGGVSVRTQNFTVQQMPLEVTLRGRTTAAANIAAVAETSGVVETVHVAKGDRVKTGDLLCTLAPGTRAAAVAQAEAGLLQAQAALAQAQLDFDTNATLRERGLAPANTASAVEVALAGARAQVSAAEASLDNARAELERTNIVAEVDGLVQAPIAVRGSMLSQGSPCATIVQLDPMLFTGAVAEANIGMARTGLDATLRTVTDQTAEGKVTYIAATADEGTRSFPVEIEFPNPDFAIRDGVTAQAVVQMGAMPGHLLPQSVLTLNDEGVLGVRAVEDGVAKFHEITIVSDTREGVWVVGLPSSVDIITIGQEFVVDGQSVQASQSAGSTSSEQGAPA